MTPDYDNGTLTAQYTTSNQSGAFTAVCTYIYDKYSLQPIAQPFDFSIANHDPAVNAEAATEVPAKISFAPLPSFLGFIEQPTKADDLAIALNALFSDEDNETLAYSPPELTNVNPKVTETLLEAAAAGDTVTLVAHKSGTLTLRITATDGDGATATFEKTITTVNLTEKWIQIGIVALAAICALILLILIIRQIRKPYFSRNSVLMFMEGQCLFDAARHDLDHTKKEQKLSRYLDMELAARNRISMDFVDSIFIKPSHRSAGGVQVRHMGHAGSYEVQLESFAVGKKYVEWRLDQELILASTTSNDMIRVVLTRDNQETVPFPTSGFDDFSSGGQDFFNDGYNGQNDDFNQKPKGYDSSDF